MTRVAGVLLVVCCCLAVVGASAVVAAADGPDTDTCVGPVDRAADAETVATTQGLQLVGDRYEKRPALLAGYGETARPVWAHDLGERGRFVGRTVDATPDGTLLVSQELDHSVVELLDDDRRPVWAVRFGVGDGLRGDVEARDALLEDGGLVVADRDRLLRYDRQRDRIDEEWLLPESAFPDEDSRVTGVAPAEDGYLVTVAGNGTGSLLALDDGGEERWRVDDLPGAHSPQDLGETALVAEMLTDRVVEVHHDGERTWALEGLDRPRSAERLPGGTTLVADRRSHRVAEFDAAGRAVWTAFLPWEPADATRAVDGGRPSAVELGVDGSQWVDRGNRTYDELTVCEAGLRALGADRDDRARSTAAGSGLLGVALAAVTLVGAAGLLARRRR